MQLKSIMLYYISEEDVEPFEQDNCEEGGSYFDGLLPETTTHFISQDDFQGDEHSWLARMGYDHEKGFEIIFSEEDNEAMRNELRQGILKNDYAVCAWQDRLLFQPNEYRINRIVEEDLMHVALRLASDDIRAVQLALDHKVSTR